MVASPAKFTFDLDLRPREEAISFDAPRLLAEATVAEMVADARTAGYSEGFAAGEQGVVAKSAKQLSSAANALADRAAAMAGAMDDMRKQTLAEAIDLAATTARKLASALISREPTAEIEALITECLASLDGVPHLVIRCNPDLADAVRTIAVKRIETSGFAGRLVVMGEPELEVGDCRLEWVDGGLVRDRAAIAQEIDKRVAAFFAARSIVSGDAAKETEQ